MRRLWLALLLLASGSAAAQNFGNINPHTVLGNPDPTASKPAVPMPFTALGPSLVPGVMPTQFGCVGDGVANDTACLQSAITAAANGTLYCGPHTYAINAPVTISAPIILQGVNENTPCIKQLVTNINLINITGTSYTEIRDMKIDAAAAGVSTSGVAIRMPAGNFTNRVDKVLISGGCVGVDLQGNQSMILNSRISGASGANCYGIRVGHEMTGSSNTDPKIVNTTVDLPASAGAAVLVEDSGGLQVSNSSFLGGLYGTKVFPGQCTGTCYPSTGAQQAIWGTIVNTHLGDVPSANAALFFDTAFAGAAIKGWSVSNSWASSASAGAGISINNTAGGTVAGFTLSAMRIYSNKTNGLEINGGASGVSVAGSRFCNNNTPNTANGTADIKVASGVNNVSVTGSLVGGACDGVGSASPEFSVALAGNNQAITLVGNDFGTVLNAGYVNGSPTANSAVANNAGFDGSVPVQTISANAVRIGAQAAQAVSTGTVKFIYNGPSGTVGGWNERKLVLYSNGGAVTYDDTGGGSGSICFGNGVIVVPQYNAAALQYNSTNFCWTVVR